MNIVCAQCGASITDLPICTECQASPILESKYKLLHAVGSGAFGTTYKAERLSDHTLVAVKEMLIRRADSVKVLELFEREARILESLDHPGIPEYFDDFVHDAGKSTAFFIVQEFIDGYSLNKVFDGPARPEEVFDALAEILEILEYLHSFSPPVVHRDIKPQNILRREDSSLVLIDFGSVRAALDTGEGGSTVAGTFGYMAPEQFMGRALPQSDVYSIGAMAVALLSADDPQKLLKQDRTFDLSRLNISEEERALLKWMTSLNPEERPSASEARIAIQNRGSSTALVRPSSTALAAIHPDIRAILRTPKPRPLPRSFKKVYLTEQGFNIAFGTVFGGIGTVVPVIVGAGMISSGQTLVGFLMPILFVLIFGGVGFGLLYSGLKRRNIARRVWTQGEPIDGVIAATGRSNYSQNGRSANRYHYNYSVNGKTFEGHWDSWSWQNLKAGDPVAVLYDPEKPEDSLMVATAAL